MLHHLGVADADILVGDDNVDLLEAASPDGWTLTDLRRAAEFRGGRCRSDHDVTPFEPADWTCGLGHEFSISPNLLLRGGHWRSTCMLDPTTYDDVARKSPFFAQVWRDDF